MRRLTILVLLAIATGSGPTEAGGSSFRIHIPSLRFRFKPEWPFRVMRKINREMRRIHRRIGPRWRRGRRGWRPARVYVASPYVYPYCYPHGYSYQVHHVHRYEGGPSIYEGTQPSGGASPADPFDQGVRDIRNGRYVQGVFHLERARQLGNRSVLLTVYMSAGYFALGSYERSAELLLEALGSGTFATEMPALSPPLPGTDFVRLRAQLVAKARGPSPSFGTLVLAGFLDAADHDLLGALRRLQAASSGGRGSPPPRPPSRQQQAETRLAALVSRVRLQTLEPVSPAWEKHLRRDDRGVVLAVLRMQDRRRLLIEADAEKAALERERAAGSLRLSRVRALRKMSSLMAQRVSGKVDRLSFALASRDLDAELSVRARPLENTISAASRHEERTRARLAAWRSERLEVIDQALR